MFRRAKWSESLFPTCSKSSSPQLPGCSFLFCVELQRIQSMKARPNLQDMVKHMHTHNTCERLFVCICFDRLLCFCVCNVNILACVTTVLALFMFMWSRFGGSSSHLSALDLSDAGSAVHTLCLPQPLLQSTEEH